MKLRTVRTGGKDYAYRKREREVQGERFTIRTSIRYDQTTQLYSKSIPTPPPRNHSLPISHKRPDSDSICIQATIKSMHICMSVCKHACMRERFSILSYNTQPSNTASPSPEFQTTDRLTPYKIIPSSPRSIPSSERLG